MTSSVAVKPLASPLTKRTARPATTYLLLGDVLCHFKPEARALQIAHIVLFQRAPALEPGSPVQPLQQVALGNLALPAPTRHPVQGKGKGQR